MMKLFIYQPFEELQGWNSELKEEVNPFYIIILINLFHYFNIILLLQICWKVLHLIIIIV